MKIKQSIAFDGRNINDVFRLPCVQAVEKGECSSRTTRGKYSERKHTKGQQTDSNMTTEQYNILVAKYGEETVCRYFKRSVDALRRKCAEARK